MNKISGYCTIRKNPTTGLCSTDVNSFVGQPMRVLEFNSYGGVLVVNPEGTHMGMFDEDDVVEKFKCQEFGYCLVPPGLDFIQQAAYSMKLTNRKGGYNSTLRKMVVLNSLRKGQYNDDFLFAKA